MGTKAQAQVSDLCREEVIPVVKHCDRLIKQAGEIIMQQNKQLKMQDLLIDDIMADRQKLFVRSIELEEANNKWYKNPFITVGLGILVGGSAALVLGR